MTKRLLAGALVGALCCGNLGASEAITSAANFAFPSVEQGGGARAIALGSTYVGIDEGSLAILWNPAGLAGLESDEIALHHDAALVGGTQDIAVFGCGLAPGDGLGLSLDYEDNGTFDGRDANGASTGTYSARAYGGSLGWGIAVPGGLSLGVTGKINEENLAGTLQSAFAADLGALWSVSPLFTAGAAYTNLGPNVDGGQLAQALRVGVSSYLEKGEDFQWLAALSGESLANGESSIHLGLEHTVYHFLALRVGYATDVPNTQNDGALGWTFGAGVKVERLAVDYSYVPLADLGGMQRISVTYAFGESCGLSGTVATVAPRMDPLATVLTLTDADFKASAREGVKETLTTDAKGRLYQALSAVSGVSGATLTINGVTDYYAHADSAHGAAWMSAIGDRRAALVRGYLETWMPKARLSSVVTKASDTASSASIFKVVLS